MARGKSGPTRARSGKRHELKSDSRRREERRADMLPQPKPMPRKPRKNGKPTKREKARQLRDKIDIPGLTDYVSEKSRELRVGFNVLQFLSPNEGSESLSSDDNSLDEAEEAHSQQSTNGNGETEKAMVRESNPQNSDSTNSDSTKSEKEQSNEPSGEEDFISLEDISDSDDEDLFAPQNGISEVTNSPPAPWWSLTDRDIDSGNAQIGEELLEYLCYVSPQHSEIARRENTIKRLRRVVRQLWHSAQVSVFGSSATGMYLPDADIDVVIISDEMRVKIRQEMHRLAARLKSNRLTNTVQVIAHARVPIVKYVEEGSQTNVDIAFGQTGGLDTARLVVSWLHEYPVLKPMGMFVRQFLKQRKLSDVANGGLGGYAMMCMMYSRLRCVISEFPSIFEASESPEENAVTVLRNGGLLVVDFFDFYGNVFDNTLQAVRCTAPFTPFNKRVNGNMHTPQPAGLAIEDPQNRENNISKASYNYPTVKRSFQNAANLLKALLLERSKPGNKDKSSLLGPLLKFRADEPKREKVSLPVALNIPNLNEEAFEKEDESLPRPPPRKKGRYDKKDDEKPKERQRTERRAEQRAKNKALEKKAAQEKNIQGKNRTSGEKNGDESAAKKRRANFDPWDSNPNVQKPKQEEIPESTKQSRQDDEEGDENDSRVKLTTAERRQFWREKGQLSAKEQNNEQK